MDKVERYRQIIQKTLKEYSVRLSRGNQVTILSVCDFTTDQYLLVSLGWQNKRREHDIVFHAQLGNGQFIIESDLTEEGIGNLLAEAGVPDDDLKPVWAGQKRSNDEVPLVA